MEYAIGIDIGGTLTKVAAVASDGAMIGSRTFSTVPPRVLADAALAVIDLTRGYDLPFPAPGGCGVGLPGVIDHRTGRVLFSGPLDWREVDFGRQASEILGCEVAVDTDVNAGALADLYCGCARDASEMLYISWGTGIGAGFVNGRRLYHSRGNAMCNFGHMPADPASERLCYCGCRGCLEVEAGGKAMVEQVAARIAAGAETALVAAELSPRSIAQAAGTGDALARAVLERSAILMARALAGLLAFLNPDTVVFGGGVSQCMPLIEDVFNAELRRRAPAFSLAGTRILRSEFGSSAGVVGAAMLPRNRRTS